MKKIIELLEKYPIRCILIMFTTLAIVPPFMIHCIYKITAPIPFFEKIIPAGSMIAYLGTVMAFCATFCLSIIVYIQNRKNTQKVRLIENRTCISIDGNEIVGISIPSVKKETSFFF